jgi:hypothetical protein
LNFPISYFVERYFRSESPDLEHVQNLGINCTLDTPGASLAAASEYYWIEACANEADRNRACGLTANEDVRYFAIEAAEVPTNELNRIGCGYGLGHPRFEEVFKLTFAVALQQLAGVISSGDDGREAERAVHRTRLVHHCSDPGPRRAGSVSD